MGLEDIVSMAMYTNLTTFIFSKKNSSMIIDTRSNIFYVFVKNILKDYYSS